MAYVLMPSVCILIALTHVGKVLGGAGWEYKGPLGPDQWYTEFKHCGGRMQSPINIETNRVLFDRNLESFDIRQYAIHEGITMTLENVGGHTVEVVYGGDPIVIRGGSLPDEYVLDQFHFHWGASNNVGSEHLMNSMAAPMEMHIVHHMKKFNRTASAVNPYGLAVLAFFFQIGEHNPKFDSFLRNFPAVVHKDTQKEITPFALADLVGDRTSGNYYRYFGSLTTPPCYETIIWTIFHDKITISQQQLDTFRTLRTLREGEQTETAISNDYRPIQPLHERTVTTNDPSLLHDSVSYLVTDLRQEVKTLQQRCSGGNGSSGAAGPAAWGMMRGWGLIAACLVVMAWMVVPRMDV